MTKHTVNHGDRQIYFQLERKNVKNINLRVRPDLSIGVSANDNVSLACIKDFVKKKGPWIIKNLDYFQSFQSAQEAKMDFVSGESVRYLGRQYRLRVRQAEIEGVKYFRGLIYIYVKDAEDFNKKEGLYKAWLNEKAHYHFNKSLDRMHKLVNSSQIPRPELRIRDMKTRWGSCHRKNGRIIINSGLIKGPKHCIDYVILHELLHFKYKNHDSNFYTYLTVLMPDWQRRKKILDEEVIMYL